MKIAIVNQHRQETLGGSEIQCDLIATGLQDNGHDVLYVAPSHKSRGEIIDTNYRIVQVERCPKAIFGAVDAFSPDLVYWRFNKHCFLGAVRKIKAAGLPVVFAVSHINDLQPWGVKPMAGKRRLTTLLRKKLRARYEHGGFRHVDALTVNNREHLRHSSVTDCTYIPNGMKLESLPFSWPRPYCAWVANIKAAKRPEVAVRLAKALGQKGVDLLMVGHIQSSDYAWLAESATLPANCRYLGPRSVEEVNGILYGSLLHLHTCQPEGFSNVFIQAWLQGRPSVSLGFDPSGYIREQRLGLVANDDEALFAEQVLTLVEDDMRRKELGNNARAFASETFSVETMVERLVAVFERVLMGCAGEHQRVNKIS